MLKIITLIVVVGFTAPVALTAQHGQKREAGAGVAGSWSLTLDGGDHSVPMGLALEQDGPKISGTLFVRGRETPIVGEFADGRLTFSTQSGTGLSHDGQAAALKFAGMLQDDGTIAGDVETPHGKLTWTAERFKAGK